MSLTRAVIAFVMVARVPAPSSGVTLEWEAPPGCPDAGTAQRVIAARTVDVVGDAALHVHVEVSEDATGWRVQVELEGDLAEGTRELHAATCEDALTATALVIGVAVDPQRPAGDDPPEAPAEPAARIQDVAPVAEPAMTQVPAASRVAPRSPRVSGRRPFIALGVAAGPDFGTVPRLGAALRGSAAVAGRHWFARVGAMHRVVRRASAGAADGSSRVGRFRMTAAQLAAGARWAWGDLELPVHAGLELGVTWARGLGEGVRPTTSRRLWSAAVAGLGLAYAPLRRLAVRLEAEGTLALTRPTFVLADVEVATIGRAGVRAWLAIELRIFPFKTPPPGKSPSKR